MLDNILNKLEQNLIGPIKEDGVQLIYYIVCFMTKLSFFYMIVGLVGNLISDGLSYFWEIVLDYPLHSFILSSKLINYLGIITPYLIFRLFKKYLSKKSLKDLDRNYLNFSVGIYLILNQIGHLLGFLPFISTLIQIGGIRPFGNVALPITFHIINILMRFTYIIISVKLIKESGFLKSESEAA
jgi:hypothetical protein